MIYFNAKEKQLWGDNFGRKCKSLHKNFLRLQGSFLLIKKNYRLFLCVNVEKQVRF